MYQASYQLKPGWSQKDYPIWILASYQAEVLTTYHERLVAAREKDISVRITLTTQDADWQQTLIERLSHQDLLQQRSLIQLFGLKKNDLSFFQHPFFDQVPRHHECLITAQDISLRSIKWLQKHPHIFALDCYAPQAHTPLKIKQVFSQHQWPAEPTTIQRLCEWQYARPDALTQLVNHCQQFSIHPSIDVIEMLSQQLTTPQVSDILLACLKGSHTAIQQLDSLSQDMVHQCYYLTLQYSRHIMRLKSGVNNSQGIFKRPDIQRACQQVVSALTQEHLDAWHQQLLELEPLLKGLVAPLDHTFAASQIQLWWTYIRHPQSAH